MPRYVPVRKQRVGKGPPLQWKRLQCKRRDKLTNRIYEMHSNL